MIAVFLTLKTIHIIAVIAWMAGLLYLPRLFVYHADAEAGSDKSETFKVMERRLYCCDYQSRDDRHLDRRSGDGRVLGDEWHHDGAGVLVYREVCVGIWR